MFWPKEPCNLYIYCKIQQNFSWKNLRNNIRKSCFMLHIAIHKQHTLQHSGIKSSSFLHCSLTTKDTYSLLSFSLGGHFTFIHAYVSTLEIRCSLKLLVFHAADGTSFPHPTTVCFKVVSSAICWVYWLTNWVATSNFSELFGTHYDNGLP